MSYGRFVVGYFNKKSEKDSLLIFPVVVWDSDHAIPGIMHGGTAPEVSTSITGLAFTGMFKAFDKFRCI